MVPSLCMGETPASCHTTCMSELRQLSQYSLASWKITPVGDAQEEKATAIEELSEQQQQRDVICNAPTNAGALKPSSGLTPPKWLQTGGSTGSLKKAICSQEEAINPCPMWPTIEDSYERMLGEGTSLYGQTPTGVKQECYAVGSDPLGAGVCQRCAAVQPICQNQKLFENDMPGRFGQSAPCAACPGRIGSLKRPRDARRAHFFCARWLPAMVVRKEQAATNSNRGHVAESVETTLLDEWSLPRPVEITLLGAYAKYGSLEDDMRAFEQMPGSTMGSWNVMILGPVQTTKGEDAVELYTWMKQEAVVPSDWTYVSALKAVSIMTKSGEQNGVDGTSLKSRLLENVSAIHADIAKAMLESDGFFVGNMLVDVSAKCGSPEDARLVLEKMPHRDEVSRYALILGYAQMEKGEHAMQLYSQMQTAGYAQVNKDEDALKLYTQRLKEGVAQAGRISVAALKACSRQLESGERRQGDAMAVKQRWLEAVTNIHASVVKANKESDVFVEIMLLAVYAKDGCPDDVRHAFEKMARRDEASWIVMILAHVQMDKGAKALHMLSRLQLEHRVPDGRTYVAAPNTCGYARQGENELVFDLCGRMQQEGVQPDSIIFLGGLTVRSHVPLGLGQRHLEDMSTGSGITLELKPFARMAGLPGHADHPKEAMEIVKAMLSHPDSAAWKCVLGAWRKREDAALGRQAFDYADGLDRHDAAAYVLMSNIYSAAHRREETNMMQAMKAQSRAWKQPAEKRDPETVTANFFLLVEIHAKAGPWLKVKKSKTSIRLAAGVKSAHKLPTKGGGRQQNGRVLGWLKWRPLRGQIRMDGKTREAGSLVVPAALPGRIVDTMGKEQRKVRPRRATPSKLPQLQITRCNPRMIATLIIGMTPSRRKGKHLEPTTSSQAGGRRPRLLKTPRNQCRAGPPHLMHMAARSRGVWIQRLPEILRCTDGRRAGGLPSIHEEIKVSAYTPLGSSGRSSQPLRPPSAKPKDRCLRREIPTSCRQQRRGLLPHQQGHSRMKDYIFCLRVGQNQAPAPPSPSLFHPFPLICLRPGSHFLPGTMSSDEAPWSPPSPLSQPAGLFDQRQTRQGSAATHTPLLVVGTSSFYPPRPKNSPWKPAASLTRPRSPFAKIREAEEAADADPDPKQETISELQALVGLARDRPASTVRGTLQKWLKSERALSILLFETDVMILRLQQEGNQEQVRAGQHHGIARLEAFKRELRLLVRQARAAEVSYKPETTLESPPDPKWGWGYLGTPQARRISRDSVLLRRRQEKRQYSQETVDVWATREPKRQRVEQSSSQKEKAWAPPTPTPTRAVCVEVDHPCDQTDVQRGLFNLGYTTVQTTRTSPCSFHTLLPDDLEVTNLFNKPPMVVSWEDLPTGKEKCIAFSFHPVDGDMQGATRISSPTQGRKLKISYPPREFLGVKITDIRQAAGQLDNSSLDSQLDEADDLPLLEGLTDPLPLDKGEGPKLPWAELTMAQLFVAKVHSASQSKTKTEILTDREARWGHIKEAVRPLKSGSSFNARKMAIQELFLQEVEILADLLEEVARLVRKDYVSGLKLDFCTID